MGSNSWHSRLVTALWGRHVSVSQDTGSVPSASHLVAGPAPGGGDRRAGASRARVAGGGGGWDGGGTGGGKLSSRPPAAAPAAGRELGRASSAGA